MAQLSDGTSNATYALDLLGEIRIWNMSDGMSAILVVTDGDMLEPRNNVKYVFINVRMMPLTSRHTDLFDSFKDRK